MNDRDWHDGAQATAPGAGAAADGLGGSLALSVPNVSEGRASPVVDALVEAVSAAGARVLDRHSDADHGRTVLTVAADPMTLQDALVALAGACVDRIDLRRHRGVHPRVGALDVVPIVARTPEDLPVASEIACGLADRLGGELNLPVFLYGAVASDTGRARPRDIRAGGLEGLAQAIEEGRLLPDAGPHRLHPTAGAVLVGVRPPLIAWNVWLESGSHADARAIASRVRESGGGLPAVAALGLYLADAGRAQVSMNLEDYRVTPPAAAMAAVRREAERLGVTLGPSELVGLIPRAALDGTSPAELGLPRLDPERVVEVALGATEPGA